MSRSGSKAQFPSVVSHVLYKIVRNWFECSEQRKSYFVDPRVTSVNFEMSDSTIMSGIGERTSRITVFSMGLETVRLK